MCSTCACGHAIYECSMCTGLQWPKPLTCKEASDKKQWKKWTKYTFILLFCVYLSSLVTCVPLLHRSILNPLWSWSRAQCSSSPWSLPKPRNDWGNSLTTLGPLSLIPWPETMFYLAAKTGRLISTQIGEQCCNCLVWVQHYEVERA